MWREWAQHSSSQGRFATIEIADLCTHAMSSSSISPQQTSFLIKYLCDCLQWNKHNDPLSSFLSSTYQLRCPHHQHSQQQDQTDSSPIIDVQHFIDCPFLVNDSNSSVPRLELKRTIIDFLNSLGSRAQSWISTNCLCHTTMHYIYYVVYLLPPRCLTRIFTLGLTVVEFS